MSFNSWSDKLESNTIVRFACARYAIDAFSLLNHSATECRPIMSAVIISVVILRSPLYMCMCNVGITTPVSPGATSFMAWDMPFIFYKLKTLAEEIVQDRCPISHLFIIYYYSIIEKSTVFYARLCCYFRISVST